MVVFVAEAVVDSGVEKNSSMGRRKGVKNSSMG
jgi:hypothetical protein